MSRTLISTRARRTRATAGGALLVLAIGAAVARAAAPATAPAPPPNSAAATPSGQAIVERYLQTQDVPSEMAFIAMVVSRPGTASKEYRFLAVHRKRADGGRDAFLRVVRPKDVQGVSLMVAEPPAGVAQVSLFLPEVGKVRPLAGGSLAGAFLGSDFTFEDLRREIPDIHDYERLEDTAVRDVPCFKVRAREKTGGSSAYAWRDLLIARDTSDLLRVDFYGRDGRLVKSLNAFDYRSAAVKGETRRPRKAVMRAVQGDAWTDFTVIEGRVGEKIPDELFTSKRQETWTPAEVEEFIFHLGMVVDGKS